MLIPLLQLSSNYPGNFLLIPILRVREDQEPAPIIIQILAISLVVGIVYVTFRLLISIFRESLGMGTFSRFFKPTPENKRLAFSVIASHLIAAEADKMREQYAFLVNYLTRHFPEITPMPYAEIRENHKLYSDPITVASWCEQKFSETEKINLLDFLIDLGFQNGVLNRKETALIYHVGRALSFPDSEIGSMLNIRFVRQEKAQKHRQQTNQQAIRSNSAEHQKLKALKILGLPGKTMEIEEVRKAYRNLARKHHPDRFHNASEEEKKMAHERFTEINWAHDFLKDRMSC